MLILGLLGMYFDAGVVFVTSQTLFQDWLWPYCGEEGAQNPCKTYCVYSRGPNKTDFQNYLKNILKRGVD